MISLFMVTNHSQKRLLLSVGIFCMYSGILAESDMKVCASVEELYGLPCNVSSIVSIDGKQVGHEDTRTLPQRLLGF